MSVTDNTHPRSPSRGYIPPPEEVLYELVKLPDDEWQLRGDALVLPPDVNQLLLRYCLYLLRYRREHRLNRLLMLTGPPGTGKSDAVRGIASTITRTLSITGNALNIRVSALYNEELGRSAKQVDKLLEDIRISAQKSVTFVLLDDAESLFMDRRHILQTKVPGDVITVATTLLAGLDRFRFQPNVIMFATLNIERAVDEAILSRADHIVPFGLPTQEARIQILRNMLTGTPGEQVLEKLAEATGGWSGRDLTKIPLKAFLLGTAATPDEMTEQDYLRAVGHIPESDVVDEVIREAQKEDICTRPSPNGFPVADSAQKNKLIWPLRRLLAQPTS
jgi:AAA+ superfamily predicted ATPase